MVNTENKIKNEKKTLESLRNENKGLIRVYEKSMAAFKKTETEKNKKREAVDLKGEIQHLNEKMKKIRMHTKDVEDSTRTYHASIVSVEERCRKMEEIVKFKKARDK